MNLDRAGRKRPGVVIKSIGALLIQKMTRRSLSPEEDGAKGPKFLVYFEVEKILNLIGGEDSPSRALRVAFDRMVFVSGCCQK